MIDHLPPLLPPSETRETQESKTLYFLDSCRRANYPEKPIKFPRNRETSSHLPQKAQLYITLAISDQKTRTTIATFLHQGKGRRERSQQGETIMMIRTNFPCPNCVLSKAYLSQTGRRQQQWSIILSNPQTHEEGKVVRLRNPCLVNVPLCASTNPLVPC